jgi:hypothetical protein
MFFVTGGYRADIPVEQDPQKHIKTYIKPAGAGDVQKKKSGQDYPLGMLLFP